MCVVKAPKGPGRSRAQGSRPQGCLRTGAGRRPVLPWPFPSQAALLLPGRGLSTESLANWPGLCVGTHLEQMFPRLHSAPGSLDKSAGVGAAGAAGQRPACAV